MKKKLFLALSLMVSVVTSAQDSFSNGFEKAAFADDGWTTYSAEGCTGVWSIVAYASESSFKSTLPTPAAGGLYAAKSKTGGLNAIGKVNPSSWLISPKITVGEGEALNFLMSYIAAFNVNAYVTSDDNRTKFDVLISTTTADTTAFTDVVYHKIHLGVGKWANYCIDLGKYAGKDIYIAFHEYGTPSATPFITNSTYIDNVSVSARKSPDLAVTVAPTFTSGTITEQEVKATVHNYGVTASSFTMSYRIGDGEVVSESVNTPLESDATLEYTFTRKAQFTESGEQTVTVWCSADGDAYNDNDTVASTAKIYAVAELPFVLSVATASTDFASSYYKRSGMTYYGWYFMTNVNAWVYTCPTNGVESCLYSTTGFALKKGKLRIKTRATATLDPAQMRVYLTRVEGEFGEPVSTVTMKTTVDATDNVFHIDVPYDGNYIIAFQPLMDANGQSALFGLEISLPIEDILPVGIDSPAEALLVSDAVPVTATFRNDGVQSHSNVKVSYRYADNAIVTETIGTINAGAELKYTFATPLDLSKASSGVLKVWSELEGDGNVANDTISRRIVAYEPKALPYSTGFESEEENLLWTTINVDNDDVFWGVEPTTVALEGSNTMYLNYVSGVESNDFAITPALRGVKDSKHRISFYYAKTSAVPTRIAKVKVYLTTSTDPAEIVKGTLIADYSESKDVYRYANAYFTIPADGIYYIAFYSQGGNADLILDDVRIDTASELVMLSTESSVTGSGYEFPDGKVTVTFANAGMTNLTNVKLSYTAIGRDNAGNIVSSASAEETFADAVAVGDTVAYTFTQPVKFTTPATYTIIAGLSHADDADAKNNSYSGEGPVLYATMGLPLKLGFEDAVERSAVALNGGWKLGSTTPYEGSYALNHSGKAAADGDWAYLNRVYVPAGTYDFSFFWKTMTNNTSDTYRQGFEVYIGTEATPEAMTTKLIELTDTLNADHKAYKELMPLVIAESGNYFIGVRCIGTNSMGSLTLDNFVIASPAEGIEIGSGETYTADFAERESEWYHYHPTRTSSQWTQATADGDTYMTTARTYTSYSGLWTTPGIYETPAFRIEAGKKYEVKFEYSLAASSTSTPLDGNTRMELYIADRDVPAAFTTKVAAGGEDYIADGLQRGTAVDTIVVASTGVYHLGFIPASTVSAKFNLHSFSLTHLAQSAVEAIDTGDEVEVSVDIHRQLRVAGSHTGGTVYSAGGLVAATFGSESEISLTNLAPGIYIVQVTTGKSVVTTKIAL